MANSDAWSNGMDVVELRKIEYRRKEAEKLRRSAASSADTAPRVTGPKPPTAAERTLPLLEPIDLFPQEGRAAPLGMSGPQIRRLAFVSDDHMERRVPHDQATSTHYTAHGSRRPLCGATGLSPGGRVTATVCAECRVAAARLRAEVVR